MPSFRLVLIESLCEENNAQAHYDRAASRYVLCNVYEQTGQSEDLNQLASQTVRDAPP